MVATVFAALIRVTKAKRLASLLGDRVSVCERVLTGAVG